MEKARSLTRSERTALHTVHVLRKMNLVPDGPHHHIEMGDIKRVSVKKSETSGWTHGVGYWLEVRERTITYSWGGGWRSAIMTLQKDECCKEGADLPPLAEDESKLWRVVHIEIRGTCTLTGDQIGSIIFSNRTAVGFIGEHLKSVSPERSFY